jgi:hypothetical protein
MIKRRARHALLGWFIIKRLKILSANSKTPVYQFMAQLTASSLKFNQVRRLTMLEFCAINRIFFPLFLEHQWALIT